MDPPTCFFDRPSLRDSGGLLRAAVLLARAEPRGFKKTQGSLFGVCFLHVFCVPPGVWPPERPAEVEEAPSSPTSKVTIA